jgi:hypothetical protein
MAYSSHFNIGCFVIELAASQPRFCAFKFGTAIERRSD